MSALQVAALLPKLPGPEPVSSRIIRLFKPRIEAPRVVDFGEKIVDDGEARRRYLDLKSQPLESLDDDDRIWVKVYEASPAFRVRQNFGEAV